MSHRRGLYACLFVMVFCGLATAQIASPSTIDQLNAEQVWKGHKQVEQCAWCHYQPGNTFTSRPTDFCQLTEARHWLSADPHATSRLRIEPWPENDKRSQPGNKLARHIVQRLGYQIDTAEGYQKFGENCLTCHAGHQAQRQPPLKNNRDGHPGISCVHCHQVNDKTEWIDLHGATSAPDTWRLLPPDAKQSHGMRHLAAADAQARLCYQCHIGDLSQNMFVSHAMYVAGHPPLPSVELRSLTEATSPHWRGPRELYTSMSAQPQARDEYFATHLSISTPSDKSIQVAPAERQWHTQATALGAVQAQWQWLTLMEQSSTERYRERWADYALYDCSGCHHGLRSPSWRQQHRQATPPGRPLPAQWPTVLEQAMTHAQGPALEQPRAEFLKAVTAKPFGHRADVGIAANNYRQALESLQASLATSALEQRFSRSSLEQLANTPPAFLSDYDSARQLRWAAASIARELESTGALPPAVAPVFELPDRSEHYDPAAFFQQIDQWRRTTFQP